MKRWSFFIVEMDSLQVFHDLLSSFIDNSYFGLIISDCKSLCLCFSKVKFCLVQRTTNTAAHCLARVAGSIGGDCEWDSVPSFLAHVLTTDAH